MVYNLGQITARQSWFNEEAYGFGVPYCRSGYGREQERYVEKAVGIASRYMI